MEEADKGRLMTTIGVRVATLQSRSNSLTFLDNSSQNSRSIDPRSSSDTKQNARYFSLQYSYVYCPFLSWDYPIHYFT